MFCADDNIPYVCSEHLDVTLERKTRGSRKSTFWMVFKNGLQMSSHFKDGWALFN